jgi:hypothetical protein
MSNLKNHQISKLKIPTAGKSTSQGAFTIELRKSAFLKEAGRKQGRLVWLLPFSKAKAL